MYRIGIVNQLATELESSAYEDSLDNNPIMLSRIQEKELVDQAKELDAVIIFSESDNLLISSISSMIFEVRKKTNALIWVYQKQIDFIHRMVFLQLGADGVADSNYFPDELRAIMLNALQRGRKSLPFTEEQYSGQDDRQEMWLNNTNSSLVVGDKAIYLTKKEYAVVAVLQANIGQVFSYQEIYETVWKKSYYDQRGRVANVVFHIREKLEKNKLDPDYYLRTVPGIGYMLLEMKGNSRAEKNGRSESLVTG